MNHAKHILLVEPDPADQLIARIAISKVAPGTEVRTASDGGAALQALESAATIPAMILLDINMPGVDGFEFLESYSQKGYPAPVVMLTSSDHDSDRARCLAYGCVVDYVHKPLELDSLRRTLELSGV